MRVHRALMSGASMADESFVRPVAAMPPALSWRASSCAALFACTKISVLPASTTARTAGSPRMALPWSGLGSVGGPLGTRTTTWSIGRVDTTGSRMTAGLVMPSRAWDPWAVLWDTDDDVVDGPRRHDRKPNDGWTRHPSRSRRRGWSTERRVAVRATTGGRRPVGSSCATMAMSGRKTRQSRTSFASSAKKGREWLHSVQLRDRIRLNACVSNLSHVFK